MAKLIIKVYPDGKRVDSDIDGVKGPDCQKIVDILARCVQLTSTEKTREYYETQRVDHEFESELT